MKKPVKRALFIVCIAILLGACSTNSLVSQHWPVKKRLYRPGWHMAFKGAQPLPVNTETRIPPGQGPSGTAKKYGPGALIGQIPPNLPVTVVNRYGKNICKQRSCPEKANTAVRNNPNGPQIAFMAPTIGEQPGRPAFSFPDESELSFQFGAYGLMAGVLAFLLISTEPVLFFFLSIAAVGFALLGLLMGFVSLFGGVLGKNNEKRKWLMAFGMLFSLLGIGIVALSLALLFI